MWSCWFPDISLTMPGRLPALSCTIPGTCVAHRDLSWTLLLQWVLAAHKGRWGVPGTLNSQAPAEATSSPSRHLGRQEQQQNPSQAQEGGLIDTQRQTERHKGWSECSQDKCHWSLPGNASTPLKVPQAFKTELPTPVTRLLFQEVSLKLFEFLSKEFKESPCSINPVII